jgi:glutamate-1-semialdehyde 2,1-aminomutase
MKSRSQSDEKYREARELMPGGVNSPVRAFRAVGGSPLFIREGHGSRIVDVDGNEYVDYCCSWGPLILGHSHPDVVAAVCSAAAKGTSFGAPTELESALAREITTAFPSIEMVRLVNSGTEAALSAIRLARGFTARSKIVKFTGCYHGHVDALLIKAGSGATTFGVPDSGGVPPRVAEDTISLPYNGLDAVHELFRHAGSEIAAVIVEPIAGNMGVVLPERHFLETLREVTRKAGALLIFDEVITGFRLCYGGAQNLYNIAPDITLLGKIIGGGLPVGAYGAGRRIMQLLAPEGPVYQAGTLSGNPIAVSAGLATLRNLRNPEVYNLLDRRANRLCDGLREAAQELSVAVQVSRVGSMFCVFFASEPVRDYDSAMRCDTHRYTRFFHALLEQGVYFPPSQFETCFLSLAHSDEDVSRTVEAARNALAACA